LRAFPGIGNTDIGSADREERVAEFRNTDDLEARLGANRPEPPVDLLQSLSLQIEETRRDLRRRTFFRLGPAVAITAVLLGALASFGGLSYAASGTAHAAKAVKSVVTSSEPRTLKQSAARDQYHEGKTTICHHAGPNHRVTITVSDSALPAHLAHGDTIGPCS
jgi:hypothetical protein